MSLIIIAPYPNEENIKDGMLMRVKAIDNLFIERKREYLNVSFSHSFNNKLKVHNEFVEEHLLHPVWDFIKIIKFLSNASTIYSHSINAFRLIPYALLFIIKNKTNIILDAHGVVPEEFQMYNKHVKALYLNIIEKMVFKRISHCISVSKVMGDHFNAKYSTLSNKWHDHIFYIYNSILDQVNNEERTELKKKIGISDNKCVLIYSGNLQKWQNIDKMLKAISTLDFNNFTVIVLTGNPTGFSTAIEEYGLTENVYVDSVSPSELGKYYSISHYGFLLRDDIIVNRVANPTKMLEYLTFGITPIVISPNIGDYVIFGYDYLTLDKFGPTIKPCKSDRNIQTASRILEINSNFNLDEII